MAHTHSRRGFLRCSAYGLGAAALLTGFDRFKLINAMAQGGGGADYKALVSIFLFGGNDGNNTFVPLETGAYNAYATVRGALAIPQANLLPVTTPGGASYGLHPGMPELQALWSQGKAAALCNVGTLVEPITRQQYLASPNLRPEDLFSHSDQQAQWQSSVSRNTRLSIPTGWGGRVADYTEGLNNMATFPTIISTGGVTLFTTGDRARPLVPSTGLQGFDGGATSTARYNALRQLLTLDRDAMLVQSASDNTGRAIDNTQLLNTALAAAPPMQTSTLR